MKCLICGGALFGMVANNELPINSEESEVKGR
jgi:hypothetical protein